MKLSPWRDAVTQPPVRPGWYDALYVEDSAKRPYRFWWTGRRWQKSPGNRARLYFGFRGDKWRGVLREDEA